MKIIADYHNHTLLSNGGNENRRHATGTAEENVKAAISKGLKRIGISEHGFNHSFYGITKENAKKLRKEIDRLNEKYPEIEILMGIECNILDDTGKIDMPEECREYFDYILAGYHFGSRPTGIKSLLAHIGNFLFKGKFNKKYNTRAIVNAIKNNDLLYVTHPGDKGDVDIIEIAKAAEETGTGLEINGHHNRLSPEMINQIQNMDIKFYIGSDAHKPEDVANFDKGIDIVRKSGLDVSRVLNIEED